MQTCVDFREFEPRARHALFFSLFEGLRENASFGFVNDHDPDSLFQQMKAMNLADFGWEYELRGPDVWRIRVSKKTEAQAQKAGD